MKTSALSEFDLYLFHQGTNYHAQEMLGAHFIERDGKRGVRFTVWAPNAKSVSVVGGFNDWDANAQPMQRVRDGEIWETFVEGLGEGEIYKYAIEPQWGGPRIMKADPYGFYAEKKPQTASRTYDMNHYEWKDAAWQEKKAHESSYERPMLTYEVHAGSWRRTLDGEYLSYRDMADQIISYVKEMHYTHIEFMPLCEHPYDGSWGYQATGYFAVTSRYGTPDDFRYLVDTAHANGIGIIMDWVPGHFPKDDFALARFDGEALYEHPDWRRGEQKEWGTYVFDFGRTEVRNFLVANALYWLDEFHIDGLRVDAVASMLYLDYSRKDGEWLPNQYGGRENLDAVQLLQEVNATVHRAFPGVLTVAEESTSWPGVTAPTEEGGLGFSLKWNMGWMNDTLEYFSKDPVHREYHHNEITFSMVYAYSEKFILPFSHDEVVHGKGSLWNRMPGDAWNKAAGLRSLFAYMWAHPGKNLLFQGQEFGQIEEWSEARSIDWYDMEGWEGEYHRGINALVRTLNSLYKELPALYSQDHTYEGFSWAKSDDASHNVLAFHRHGTDGSKLLCVFNFGGASHLGYTLGVPEGGQWVRILNTDDGIYEGADNDLPTEVEAVSFPWDGYDFSVQLHVPAMSGQWYRWEPEK